MRINLIIFLFLSFCRFGFSQNEIIWTFSYNQKLAQIELTAKLADGWHLYSQHIASDIGPVPTHVVFAQNKALQLLGDVIEPDPIKRFDQAFEAELAFFEKQVTFTQKVKKISPTSLKGTLTFMLCNDEMCLPPEEKEFEITIN